MSHSPRPTVHSPQPLARLGATFGWRWHGDPQDIVVTGVSLSTGDVHSGDLFVALPGRTQHGAHYVREALDRGAHAILTDPTGAGLIDPVDCPAPVAIHDDPRSQLGAVARDVYDPHRPLPPVFAVTGTNGKTSVVFFLDAICRQMGLVSGFSNTHERRIGTDAVKTPLTTPEAPELQALMAVAAERGVEVMALEASAQAIERHRLDGIIAQVAGFTNLSHDHLEDYGDLESYFQTKAKLFDHTMATRAVVSLDTEWGAKLVTQTDIPTVSVGPTGSQATWTYDVTQATLEGSVFELHGPSNHLVTSIRSIGAHMVSNAALAIVMLIEGGMDPDALAHAISTQRGGISRVIPGRLERVSTGSPVHVFVDAGRSPEAYRETLATIAAMTDGSLTVVCGTSGNRDRTKRATMGSIAAQYSQRVIVTDDDPRREDPAQIRDDILKGVRQVPGVDVEEIAEQERAIRSAVAGAQPGDCIVWIGPGSQSYRDVGGVRQAFSARHEAQRALLEAGWLTAPQEVAS